MSKSYLEFPKKKKSFSKVKTGSIALLVVFVTWSVLSGIYADTIIPAPAKVTAELFGLLSNRLFYLSLGNTLYLVSLSFIFSSLGGISLGLTIHYFYLWGRVIKLLVDAALYIPAVVIIYLAVVIIGLGSATTVTSVSLVLIPELAVLFSRALEGLDRHYYEIAKVYKFTKWDIFRRVVMPQLLPAIKGIMEMALAVSWKLVVLVESFAQVKGIGYRLHEAFSYFSIVKLLAWLLGFMLSMAAVKVLVLTPLWNLACAYFEGKKND